MGGEVLKNHQCRASAPGTAAIAMSGKIPADPTFAAHFFLYNFTEILRGQKFDK